ncbi:MAG TPA: HAD-IIIC family phosphatase [Candidatus Binatus sp.]|nr:HAD-IIIC family phosphatase [Candidatus Binatus sp.]
MKLIEALETLKRRPPAQSPLLEVQLACGFTPLHFLTFLKAHLRRQFPEHALAIGTGLFGDLLGDVRRLRGKPPCVVVVVMEWQDLDPRLGLRQLGGWGPRQLSNIIRDVREQAGRITDSIETISESHTVTLAAPTLPLPPIALTPSWQSSSFENDIRDVVASVVAKLSRLPRVRVVSSQRLDQISVPGARLDVKSELDFGFPYSLLHADAFAGLIARIIRDPLPKKGLITDLDHTLWKGILGEVNVEGIAWDIDEHAQQHGLYQQLLASLAEAGILIAVASKNDPTLVEEAFRRRSPILHRKQIFPLEISWGAKSESISRILRAWNLGADSVVFVDDSPLELAEVKAAHPEIECLLFPQDDERAAYQLLQDVRDLFGKQCICAEDEIRAESTRTSQAAAEATEPERSSSEDFLRSIGGKLTLSFSKNPPDPRALELINKTNQFNLNGRRHTESSWMDYLNDPKVFLLLGAYEDKFGPLGKIAVMAGRQDGDSFLVDYWVMSCRALSRRIEQACLRHLFRKFGVEEANFDFALTSRNGPIQAFFLELTGIVTLKSFSISKQQLLDKCPAVYLQIEEDFGE